MSLFVAAEEDPIRWAADMGADRVELYTEPFAKAFAAGSGEGAHSFERYVQAAEHAHKLGLGINAGHDRTDRAIDNRGRRYVGDGVDDVTHRNPPQRGSAREQKNGNGKLGR